MLSRMLTEACGGLRSLAAFNADPELADDTFLLVGRMLAYSPRLVLAPGPLATLLDTALAGMLVQHRCVSSPSGSCTAPGLAGASPQLPSGMFSEILSLHL